MLASCWRRGLFSTTVAVFSLTPCTEADIVADGQLLRIRNPAACDILSSNHKTSQSVRTYFYLSFPSSATLFKWAIPGVGKLHLQPSLMMTDAPTASVPFFISMGLATRRAVPFQSRQRSTLVPIAVSHEFWKFCTGSSARNSCVIVISAAIFIAGVFSVLRRSPRVSENHFESH